jgi:hypothetical protein
LGAVIETWNGSTKIGESSELIHDCYVPSNIKPSLGTITLDPVNITTLDNQTRDILVKGKNKISVSVSGSKAGTGSSIKSYTFAVLSGSTTIASTTTTNTSVSFGPFSNTGTLKFRVTVTDNRSRSASNSGNELTFTCHDYEVPSFSAFNAYRVASISSTTANDNGTYLRCTYNLTYSSVGGTNNVDVKIFYKKNSASSWSSITAVTDSTSTSGTKVLSSIDAGSTYSVYAQVTDNYGGSAPSTQNTTFGASRIFNIRSNGTGIAFGKMAETDDLLESKWPAKFDDDCEIAGTLTVGTSTQNTTPTTGIAIHDVRSAAVTPDSFGNQNVNFYFSTGGTNLYQSILHMKGWRGNYAAWELAGNADDSSNDNTLKYRQGIGDTWGDWQTVITNKNINSYVDMSDYLPLSAGVALSGRLGLQGDAHYTNGSYGLNCNNSDIINANGTYFNRATSAGNGINFYRWDGNWDTLYAIDGALRFQTNRGTGTGLGGKTIYHNGNFQFETGTITLNSSKETSKTFASTTTFAGTPQVFLTPITSNTGSIAAKIRSVNSAGFTAIIGGSVGDGILFSYIAIYGNAV